MNYKQKLISLITSAIVASSSFQAQALTELTPPSQYKKVSQQLVEILEGVHYNKTPIDDAVSAIAFDEFINSLDPTKSFFLAEDIDNLSQYRLQFDDAIKSSDPAMAYTIYNLYQKRVEARLTKTIEQLPELVSAFDYTKDEYFNADPDDAVWQQNDKALDELWRKRIKHRTLTLRLDKRSDEDIVTSLTKRYKNQLKQLEQTDSVDVYQTFANSLASALDPHTSYFAPRASESFNINMRLSLEGIGAVLQQEDDYTQVVRIVPAGPADKQGELAPNDKIVAVGQESGEMVDVVGMRLDDVVSMIRGERDSKVRLEIIPAKGDGQTHKTITIVRDKVKLEDQSAKKEIVTIERQGQEFKIGVIKLPTFYSDFAALQAGDADYKSSTRDTKKLIEELKEEGIHALVLDLRNNGGGSLQEANALMGLFIPSGPVVQIKDAGGRVSTLGDRDKGLAYSGPMAVMINRMSASASEIVAGAIQDYGRGLVLGGQSFGKGTVQVLQNVDQGQVKITQAKFYRVSGESTQHKGVMPDIEFPSFLNKDVVGESALDNPLPWDKIHETRYPVYWQIPDFIPELDLRHKDRLQRNPDFIALADQIDHIKKQEDRFKALTLNEEKRLKQIEENKQIELDRENTRRKALGLETVASLDDINEEDNDQDIYTEEAAQILLDFIGINQRQAANSK
ncbi:tail-specific protease [Marinomonas agarivorans]|nr:tail-specific protease [Marinomonas agarivorans]